MKEDQVQLRGISQPDLLAHRAYEEIQEAIFSGKLPPGTALSVPNLARQLGISRSPVREAVQRLVCDGLAVSVSYRGAVVAHFSPEDLILQYEIREMLEGLATRRATERLTLSARAELEDLVKQHRQTLQREEGVLAHIELDMQFHQRISELADNKYLAEMLNTLQGQVRLAMHYLWRRDDAPRRALAEHEKILAAMSSGDPAAAEAAARAHIARVRTDLAESKEYRER